MEYTLECPRGLSKSINNLKLSSYLIYAQLLSNILYFHFKSVPYMLQIRKCEHANMRNKDGANH